MSQKVPVVVSDVPEVVRMNGAVVAYFPRAATTVRIEVMEGKMDWYPFTIEQVPPDSDPVFSYPVPGGYACVPYNHPFLKWRDTWDCVIVSVNEDETVDGIFEGVPIQMPDCMLFNTEEERWSPVREIIEVDIRNNNRTRVRFRLQKPFLKVGYHGRLFLFGGGPYVPEDHLPKSRLFIADEYLRHIVSEKIAFYEEIEKGKVKRLQLSVNTPLSGNTPVSREVEFWVDPPLDCEFLRGFFKECGILEVSWLEGILESCLNV